LEPVKLVSTTSLLKAIQATLQIDSKSEFPKSS
jgi:hypothetical protein